jgi:hypothetical protein
MENMPVETPQVSAELVTRGFVQKLDEGRIKEAEAQGSAYIRDKLREDSIVRRGILEPKLIVEDDLDLDEDSDQPKKIVFKEPDSAATFTTFKGTPERRYFEGPRYPIYFGQILSEKFTKNKFELMTYKYDIRKVLSENSVKDMSDKEDYKFFTDAERGLVDLGLTDNRFSINTGGKLTQELIARGIKALFNGRIPMGKMVMTKKRYVDTLEYQQTQVGSDIMKRHYDDGVLGEERLFGVPVVTTLKDDIISDNEVWFFGPEEFMGKHYLLQDATLFIKQEGPWYEFYSYMGLGIGIGNFKSIVKITITA